MATTARKSPQNPKNGGLEGTPQKPFATSLQALAKRRSSQLRLTTRGIAYFANITSARDVRKAAGLSLGDIAKLVVERTERKRITTGALANMERNVTYRRNVDGRKKQRYPMPDDIAAIYADCLCEAVRDVSDFDLDIEVKPGVTVWRVKPLVRCAVCGDWHTPHVRNQARCKWCIKHHQRKTKPVLRAGDLGGVL